jgi:predicted Rossmann fold flavoprotein
MDQTSSAAASHYDVIVIGAGAAGLIAAMRSAQGGRRTLLLEKNRRPGVKILMSGGTRCNLTQNTDNRGIIAAYALQGPFLHSALAALGVSQTLDLFHSAGLATKVEDTGKIFPQSDRATDVLAALLKLLGQTPAELALGEPVIALEKLHDDWRVTTNSRTLTAEKIIVTTGGQSYPGCGTTGDAYDWARRLGHTVITPTPALVPITVNTPWVRQLQGITIHDTHLQVVEPPNPAASKTTGEKLLAERRGSLLFAHFGLTGPVALDVSRAVSCHPQPHSLLLRCDFLPSLPRPALEETLRGGLSTAGKKLLLGALVDLLPAVLPRRMVEVLLVAGEMDAQRKAAEVGKTDRARICDLIKRMTIQVSGTRGFAKAEVTAGGVALSEVDSRTMQSKIAPGLFLAGEVLDLDGPIGGYNFQAAWSTGYLAGQSTW